MCGTGGGWCGRSHGGDGTEHRGPFDVLPQHANFISIISKKLVIKTADKKNREFNVESGILQVRRTKLWYI